ncbi:aspartate aminotransferase family protein [Methanospirillum lacunae]|uniref:Glutamate-1-semialdehyde 2,1-aminomutase n=2 Tax=Methanospirillum lacunae TaxID=668570 RepID=A0A2V2N522_9EURY|nr:aspartate aminotransferase family protein [Methanospirillum lacunae]PWR72856.1 aspartate aminotransferase family protein [Methanospirillum lacunae]
MISPEKRYKKSMALWKKAPQVILNGVQTLSKSPLHIAFGACPIFVEKAKGAYFWDCDGNRYIDYPLALGPIVLGHAYPRVDRAVKKQMKNGSLFSLSSPKEIELAELLCAMIPSAQKVKFLKSGSEAMSAAVRIARAYTQREHVAVCGYHGWHDWTVCRTTRNVGVETTSQSLIHEFSYNDIDSLLNIIERFPDQIAAIILEPVGMYAPKKQFLKKVAKVAKEHGALLIFDEIITGFRLSPGGAQEYFSVTPDISAFGKAMGNGYPISALVGKKEILDEVEDKVFISSTYGGDLLAITAAIETLNIISDENVTGHLHKLGKELQRGLGALINETQISGSCEGLPHKTFLVFNDTDQVSGKLIQTLFRQESFARGVFLGYGHFISYSHTKKDIQFSLDMASEVFKLIDKSINNKTTASLLKGPIAEEVFKRY